MAKNWSTAKINGYSDITQLTNAIMCAELGREIVDEVQKATKEAANKGVEKLKSESQQFTKYGHGNYAKGWSKKQEGDAYILYNEDYRLPHLLENPHPIIAYGKVVAYWQGKPHIKPVELEVESKLLKKINDIVDKGIKKV